MIMNCTLKAAIAAFILAVGFAGSVAAGPFEDALAAYNGGKYAEALKFYRLAADRGDANAQVNLGNMYAHSEGVLQSYVEALKWFRLAADQGSALGQYNLGVMYANGRGVTQNTAEALKWYRLAADKGNADARNNLGVMYDKGLVVPQNYVEAAKWFRLAADQGSAAALRNLGELYAHGHGVPQDTAEAQKWRNLAEATRVTQAKELRQKQEQETNEPKNVLFLAYTRYILIKKCFEDRQDYLVKYIGESELERAKVAVSNIERSMKHSDANINTDLVWTQANQQASNDLSRLPPSRDACQEELRNLEQTLNDVAPETVFTPKDF